MLSLLFAFGTPKTYRSGDAFVRRSEAEPLGSDHGAVTHFTSADSFHSDLLPLSYRPDGYSP